MNTFTVFSLMGVAGVVMMAVSAWAKDQDWMMFGFFWFVAAVLSLGMLLT